MDLKKNTHICSFLDISKWDGQNRYSHDKGQTMCVTGDQFEKMDIQSLCVLLTSWTIIIRDSSDFNPPPPPLILL